MHILFSKLYVHSSNDIIHGDIKPENLLLCENDLLKIADFGVSFILNEETCPNADGVIGRSQGTPAFTAPETGNKSFSAYPIDVWAMGVTLYMMITGICPFAGNGIFDTYEKIKNEHPPMPTNVSDELKDFLERILRKDPTKRIDLKEAMVHDWITKNGKEPLTHSDMLKDKRVSVTKEDIEYAVSLPSHTIKHLRSMSNDISGDCKQNESDQQIVSKPQKKSSQKELVIQSVDTKNKSVKVKKDKQSVLNHSNDSPLVNLDKIETKQTNKNKSRGSKKKQSSKKNKCATLKSTKTSPSKARKSSPNAVSKKLKSSKSKKTMNRSRKSTGNIGKKPVKIKIKSGNKQKAETPVENPKNISPSFAKRRTNSDFNKRKKKKKKSNKLKKKDTKLTDDAVVKKKSKSKKKSKQSKSSNN